MLSDLDCILINCAQSADCIEADKLSLKHNAVYA